VIHVLAEMIKIVSPTHFIFWGLWVRVELALAYFEKSVYVIVDTLKHITYNKIIKTKSIVFRKIMDLQGVVKWKEKYI